MLCLEYAEYPICRPWPWICLELLKYEFQILHLELILLAGADGHGFVGGVYAFGHVIDFYIA